MSSAPRIDTPDLGEPLSIDSVAPKEDLDLDPTANTSVGPIERDEPISVALDDNKPSLSSPLKNSTLASDIDPTSQAVPAQQQSRVKAQEEGVLSAVGAAASYVLDALFCMKGVRAHTEKDIRRLIVSFHRNPAAAADALSNKAAEVTNSLSSSSSSTAASTTSSLPSVEQVQSQATQLANSATQTAQKLAHQAIDSLPAGVAAYIPDSLKGSSQTASAATPQAGNNTSASETPVGTVAGGSSDITKPHTTGNFEASGMFNFLFSLGLSVTAFEKS